MRKTDASEERQSPRATAGADARGRGTHGAPRAAGPSCSLGHRGAGVAAMLSPRVAASSARAPGQQPPRGDLRFHGLLSQVSVVSDETRSVSRGSPAGLRQVTV